ncbi:hypothetical protein COW46_01045 [Candidatus Gracilibacteria bacterium CG17_big_fil_post_rev_8_21_14_2_50_48_13]|nr:MAG: hypothetical protein COW46_01045 [Candidatus Gracilibacteria bacterium CG17_big_fil_post_rev_8_21_14_2_50_48_13]
MKKGFVTIDVLLGMVLLGLVISGIMLSLISLYSSNTDLSATERVVTVLQESNEALRSIRNKDFETLVPGTYGLAFALPQGWTLSPSPDVVEGMNRQVVIETVSQHVRRLTTTISWDGGAKTSTSVVYLTNWKKLFEQAPHLQFLVDDNELISDGRGNSEIHGLLLGNDKSSPIVVDKVEITWDKPMHELKEIIVGGNQVWSSTGPGTPTGLQQTPALVDITDLVIGGNGTILIDKFVFTGNVNNVDVTIRFIMGDGSEKTGNFHSQQG